MNLSLRLTGIKEPIQVTSSSHMLGLGKLTEYLEMSAEAAKERKKLEVEIEETEAVKKRRQVGGLYVSLPGWRSFVSMSAVGLF